MADIPMRHYDSDGNVDIDTLGFASSELQLRTVWEPRGWERAPAEVAMVAEVTGEPVIELEALTKAQLHEIAAGQDIEVPSRATKDEIIAALADSPTALAIAEAATDEEAYP